MRNFVTYIAKESELTEEVHARVAYLYQQLNIAHLIRIHVEFLKEGSPERDTLDAPEGYLYLSDMELTEKHPFFKRIGGRDAITTETFGKEEKVETIRRGEKDIDVFGRLSRPVVYRDTDGTVVNSSRVYRCASESRLYGLGNVEMVRPRPTKKDEWVFTGQMFTVDDQLTSKIVVRGKLGSPPRFSVRQIGK